MAFVKIACGPFEVCILPRSFNVAQLNPDGLSEANKKRLTEMQSVTKREEFLRTRWAVRTLWNISYDPEVCSGGNLKWPDGTNGSISHKDGHIAIVKSTSESALGIDLENCELSLAIAKHVCLPEETAWIGDTANAATSISQCFAIKEAAFKAFFPKCETRFWFNAVCVTPTTDKNIFDVELKITLTSALAAGRVFKAHVEDIAIDDQRYTVAVLGTLDF
jgi:4'-phosphopantetheinyl transferase EntD